MRIEMIMYMLRDERQWGEMSRDGIRRDEEYVYDIKERTDPTTTMLGILDDGMSDQMGLL